MRWNNKTRKMFIFIVSLLFILQAVAFLGSAEDPAGEDLDNLGIPNESGDTKDDSSDGNIEGDAPLLDTNDEASSKNYYIPPSYYTRIVSPSVETSNDIDPKYETYESALSAVLISGESDIDIASYYYEETSVLEVTVTSGGEAIPDAPVTVFCKVLTTDDSGSIQASIPLGIVDNSDNVLIKVKASTNDEQFTTAYAPLYEEGQVNIEDGYRAFIQNTKISQALKNMLLAVI